MTDEEARIKRAFEIDLYKLNSRPEKIYYVSQYWEDRAEKERNEPDALFNLMFGPDETK